MANRQLLKEVFIMTPFMVFLFGFMCAACLYASKEIITLNATIKKLEDKLDGQTITKSKS